MSSLSQSVCSEDLVSVRIHCGSSCTDVMNLRCVEPAFVFSAVFVANQFIFHMSL